MLANTRDTSSRRRASTAAHAACSAALLLGPASPGRVGQYWIGADITRDRWNWKRIAKWGLGLPLVGALMIGTGVYLYDRWEDRPTPQTSFGDIALTAKKPDVKFTRGEPASTDGPDRWVYNAGSRSAGPEAARYLVNFRDDRIRFVLYTANETQIGNPWLMGFTIGTPHERVLEKLGQPSSVANSANDLDRMFSYEKYNVFFSFTQGKIVAFGIYEPKDGPMAFRNAASAPAK